MAIGIGGLSEVIRARQAVFAETLRVAINIHLTSIPRADCH
jgi:hypothetical protein